MDNPETGAAPTGAAGHPPAGAPRTPWPPSAQPAGPPPAYPAYRPTNGLAIAALVTGLVGLVSCPFIGAAAVYLGYRARAEIRATGEEGDSLALAGLILGWCAVGVAVLVVLFAAAYFGFLAVMIGVSAATGSN